MTLTKLGRAKSAGSRLWPCFSVDQFGPISIRGQPRTNWRRWTYSFCRGRIPSMPTTAICRTKKNPVLSRNVAENAQLPKNFCCWYNFSNIFQIKTIENEIFEAKKDGTIFTRESHEMTKYFKQTKSAQFPKLSTFRFYFRFIFPHNL